MEKKILLKVSLEHDNNGFYTHVDDFDFRENVKLETVYRNGVSGNPYTYVTYTKVNDGDVFDHMINNDRRSDVIKKAEVMLEQSERDKLETLLSALDMFKAELRSN